MIWVCMACCTDPDEDLVPAVGARVDEHLGPVDVEGPEDGRGAGVGAHLTGQTDLRHVQLGPLRLTRDHRAVYTHTNTHTGNQSEDWCVEQ